MSNYKPRIESNNLDLASILSTINELPEVGGDTGRLPSEYQETEYIQSSGTQYINSGYVPSSQNFRVVYDFKLPSSATTSYLFGGMNTTHSIISSVRGVFYVGSSSNPVSLTLSSNVRYQMDAHAESGTFTVVLNGTTKSVSYSGSLDNSMPIFLFTHSKSGGYPEGSTWATFTLYACQIFDNGALVRDFVPCYRKIDAVVGLYDLVNGVFYTSAGSGAFITGPAISPEAEQLQIIDILTGEVE